ncbi:MAG: serine protease [Parasphingorhabdus sp.]|nr:serine protease [Parasphingorhabdus sp.]
MQKILSLFTLAFAFLLGSPVGADPADISAASRSVVRIVLAAKDGDRLAFVGHGSGFAVAPDKIITNYHVIALALSEPNIVIGIIPSQGKTSYGGRILAVTQNKDLALLQLQDAGRIPPMAIFSGPVTDGENVMAIGYPGAVDRAQGLNLDDMINPIAPVKTSGIVSGGRSSKDIDTILHTAPIAAGNSGGPLVDDCGRVIGANSFGSLSEGSDAEFGFAVSNRELISFLRKTGVRPDLIAAPCRSSADLSREEAARAAAEQDKATASKVAAEQKLAATTAKLQVAAEREVITERENRMALAALLLVLGVIIAGAAAYLAAQKKREFAIGSAAAAGVMIIGAVLTFLSRPAFSEVDDRVATELGRLEATPPVAAADGAEDGKYLCTLNPMRSRITVNQTSEINLNWAAGGCVNGRTQYGSDGSTRWSRIFVPNEEQTVTISSFDPDRRIYSTERYLLDLDTMQRTRAIRSNYRNRTCTTNTAELADIAEMVKAIRSELPAQPNERLIYECQRADESG